MRYALLLFVTLKLVIAQAQPRPQIIKSEYIFDTAPFKACHASTIVKLSGDKLMAAWFGGTAEGNADVCIWSATKTGDKWSAPVLLANGKQTDGTQQACWNPVLFLSANKKLYLYYKVGLNPRVWKGFYKVSADEGKSWSAAQALPDGFLGPIKNKPIQLKNKDILYPSSTESTDEKQWRIHLEVSDGDLKKWRQIAIDCDTFQVIQPSILRYSDTKLQLLCRSKQNTIVQSWSADNGNTWSKLTRTALPNPNSGSDAVTLPNHLQLLVYNPLKAGANWWEGRSVLKVATSKDGINWTDIYTLVDEKTGEYSYPAVICDDAGNVHITYTDKRSRIRYVMLRP